MNRISVEQVREAYAQTGREKCRGKYNDANCVCPSVVCALAHAGDADLDHDEPVKFVVEKLGVTSSYIGGFTRAVDGLDDFRVSEYSAEDFEQGYTDGQLVAADLFGESK